MTYTDTYASRATGGSSSMVTAFFDDRTEAESAVQRLAEAGVPRSNIKIVADDKTAARETEHKGFWASLEDLFFPDDDRSVYAEGIRRGGYLVTVSGYAEELHGSVLDILDDEGSVDIDQRAQAWEAEGWSRSSASTETADSRTGLTAGSAMTRDADSKDVIPVVEEELRVGKRDIGSGRVRVRSYTREIPVSESVSLRDETVEVTRRAVDRPLDGSEAAFVDRTIEAEEHREEAVVSKEARVVEEIELRKTAQQREETVADTVRKTEVEVEDDRETARTGLRDI